MSKNVVRGILTAQSRLLCLFPSSTTRLLMEGLQLWCRILTRQVPRLAQTSKAFVSLFIHLKQLCGTHMPRTPRPEDIPTIFHGQFLAINRFQQKTTTFSNSGIHDKSDTHKVTSHNPKQLFLSTKKQKVRFFI